MATATQIIASKYFIAKLEREVIVPLPGWPGHGAGYFLEMAIRATLKRNLEFTES